MRSPAAHPSVRSCSSSSAESPTGTPAAANRARASSSEKLRSSARISLTSPSSRKRGNPSRRSRRVTSTNRSSAGERINRSLSWRSASPERSSWRSSSTNHSGPSIAARSVSRRSTIASAFRSGFGVIASMAPRSSARAAKRAQNREPEALRVLLRALHGDPRGALASARLGDPGAQQRCLAAACRRRHDRHASLFGQPGEQLAADDGATGTDVGFSRI